MDKLEWVLAGLLFFIVVVLFLGFVPVKLEQEAIAVMWSILVGLGMKRIPVK